MNRKNIENRMSRFHINSIRCVSSEKTSNQCRIIKIDTVSKEKLKKAKIEFAFDAQLVNRLFLLKNQYKTITKFII